MRNQLCTHRFLVDINLTIPLTTLTFMSGFLIGNQCLDFAKQDGVTEIEESIMANSVEQKLNDALFRDEVDGKVVITRKPIFVSW